MEYLPGERRLAPIPMPSRKSRLETYIFENVYQETVLDYAEDFITDKTIHPYGVLIPVAAHQEAGRIAKSMAEYAAQEDAEPTTIFLFLNYPSYTANYDDVNNCVEEVERAKSNHPELDIRYTIVGYPEPIIGEIRKDLWDAVLYAALHDGIYDTPDGEFIGINHDIDTERISKHYLRNVQNYYKEAQAELNASGVPQDAMKSRFTRVKHAYDFERYPNVSRGALWGDFVYRQSYRNGSYEEGLVVPLTYYALAGGFDATARTLETRNLIPPDKEGIPGTSMDTSLRRYVSRFGGYGYENLWTDDSFTANDDCRVSEPGQDITSYNLEENILDAYPEHMKLLLRRVPASTWNELVYDCWHPYLALSESINLTELQQKIESIVRPQIKLAQSILSRVVDLPELAEKVGGDDMIGLAVKIHADWIIKRATVRSMANIAPNGAVLNNSKND